MYQQPSRLQQLLSSRRNLLVIGLIAAALIVGIIMLTSNNGGGVQEKLERLAVRYDNLVKITKTAASKINNQALSKLNAEATALLTSDNTAIATLVKERYGSIPGDITKSETDTISTDKLKNALQLNTYDTTYKLMLQDKLNNLFALSGEILKKTNNSTTTKTLTTARTNLQSIYTRLGDVKL